MINPFSYNEYENILKWIKSNYNILQFSDIDSTIDNFCVIRHDVEYSIDRAYELAKLEAKHKIKSTYLFQIRNNCYNALSIQNTKIIQKIHSLGHSIGLHVHCGLLDTYNSISDMIKQDANILESITKIDINIFSLHRPTIELLLSNIKIPGFINTYDNLYFHAYKNRAPKELNVKYVADSNHTWKYGYPTTVFNPKLQLNFHPFSWTKRGHENTPNFKTLLNEKNLEMKNSIHDEIKTFPNELLL